jgi:hypothetical protein
MYMSVFFNTFPFAPCGLAVVSLPLDPRFAGSNLAKDYGFLRVIKILSTTSFGGEVKPLVPCHKFLWHVKESCKYERDTLYAKFSSHFFAKFLLLCC